MALKHTIRPGGTDYCPECKEPISKQANKCPHCQSDLTENEAWQESKAKSEEERAGGCPMALLTAAAFLVGISYGVWVLIG